MTKRKLLTALMAIALGGAVASTAQAIPSPAPVLLNTGGSDNTVVGLETGTFLAVETNSFSAGGVSGSIQSWVYSEGAGNGLDFWYLVSNTSPTDILTRATFTDFTGFTTYVGYQDNNPSGGVAPLYFDRNTADTVGAQFYLNIPGSPLGSPIAPGQSSDYLLVYVPEATGYTQGLASAIDGGAHIVEAYAPSTSVPEPSTLLMIGSGLVGAGFWLRRRKA